MNLNSELLAANKKTEICSVFVAPDDLERNLTANRDEYRRLARLIQDANPEQLLLVGSGASYCTLHTAQYFMSACSSLPVLLMRGPDMVGARSNIFGARRAFAVLASYSGKTADTLEAAEYLKGQGIPRLAVCRESNRPLAGLCDAAIAYRSQCLYTSAMANVLMILTELMKLRGETKSADTMQQALRQIPGQMRSVMGQAEAAAAAALARFGDETFFYVLGDGPLYGLAYQYGYTNLMEYARVHAAVLPGAEWRHGPLEVLFRKPALIHFVADDDTRKHSLAARNYCERRGGRTLVFDVRDYFDTHPALAPFVLHSVTQIFLLYLCTHHGTNMDSYLEMHVHPYIANETYY